MKFVNTIGLIMFLGSILTFVLVSIHTQEASLTELAFGRGIISHGTSVLTLPGIWLLTLASLWTGFRYDGIKNRLVQAKFVLLALIIVNAYVFVVPAATLATQLAIDSVSQGQLLAAYTDAYMKESIMGGINVILGLVVIVLDILQTSRK